MIVFYLNYKLVTLKEINTDINRAMTSPNLLWINRKIA